LSCSAPGYDDAYKNRVGGSEYLKTPSKTKLRIYIAGSVKGIN